MAYIKQNYKVTLLLEQAKQQSRAVQILKIK